MVVYFSFLFHIYQPPVQIAPVIKQIVNESYRPLIEALYSHPEAKITLNINGTLTEQLHDFGYDDLIGGITTLASRGQIDFTGSAKFHPLLPLMARRLRARVLWRACWLSDWTTSTLTLG